MTSDEVLEEFRAAGALLEGHFILTSGRHSPIYLNKSLVGMHPDRVTRLIAGLIARVRAEVTPQPTTIVSPVMGAIVFGFETARQLETPFVFLERGPGDQGFVIRRGFSLPKGSPVLVVEDIVSTGLSARESIDAVRAAGADPVALACLVDRSGGRALADIGAPVIALATLDVPDYPADALPDELAAIPAVKPGSRAQTQAESAS